MTNFVNMPLYDSYDYEYPVSLQGNSYIFRMYFNERLQEWYLDLIDDNGVRLISGRRMVFQGTVWVDEVQELSGCFYLEPIGLDKNETAANYDKLYKYYKMFYLYT